MTKLPNEFEKLNSVEEHAAVLKSVVTPAESLPWILKLLGLSKHPMFSSIPDCSLTSIKISQIKAFNACDDDSVDADATYLKPYLLEAIANRIQVTPIHTAITNSWQRHNYYNLLVKNGFENAISALVYTGDEDKLKQVIANMLQAWNHKKTAIPVSIILPLEQEDWDCFYFDEKATTEFLSSTYGKVSMVSLLQLLNLQDNFIDAFLRLTGITYPKSKEHYATLVPLNQRYDSAQTALNGYCLSSSTQPDIEALMLGEDKLNTNEYTPVIPRIKRAITEEDTQFGVISATKYQVSEGKTATENDLAKIRDSLSYCMTNTGGVVITFDIPVLDESIRMGRCSTPTLIAPKRWLEIIKANRPSNNRQKRVDTLPVKKTNETNRQQQDRINKTQRILRKQFERDLQDQTLDKSDKKIHYCYPAPIANR